MKRQIEQEYKKLMKDVATSDYYKVDLTNRVNCYTCSEGHIAKTKDIDAGVTPMFIQCKCDKRASSSFYTDSAPSIEPTHEWYRPSLAETLKLKFNMLDHVLCGGLMIRKIVKPK